MKRRDFIRTVVASGAGAGALGGIERVYSQMPNKKAESSVRHIVREPGHQLRDGKRFDIPEPSEFRDVVIIGAGANGLFSAYELADIDLVCLEKEPRSGGNAQRMQWNGLYATEGTAFLVDQDADVVDYMDKHFDLRPTALKGKDAFFVGNKLIHDFYTDKGFRQLPYSDAIKDEFQRLKRLLKKEARRIQPAYDALIEDESLNDEALIAEAIALENTSFEQWLKQQGFGKEVMNWIDIYNPPQNSCYARNMSALVGIIYNASIGDYSGGASYPGGLAVMAETLSKAILQQGNDRIRCGCFVVRVANVGKDQVDVTYLLAGKLRTIRCKACIWAGQKHIARHVIADMPQVQKDAIGQMTYNDISVINLCYNKTIYSDTYLTWLDNSPINNIAPATWINKGRDVDYQQPQILSCDWTNRPEHRGLLLSEHYVVEHCQKAARHVERLFPGSINHLEEIRLVLRAHSWVAEAPGYYSKLYPVISEDVGRIVVTSSDHGSFDDAFYAGIDNAKTIRRLLKQ